MKHIPLELYKQIMEVMPILCVDLVIRNKNTILLIQRNNNPLKGEWWIPGGRVHKNEPLKKAAIRKAKEECGLTATKVKELGTYEYIGPDAVFPDIKTGIHTLSVVFEVTATNKTIHLDAHHEDHAWVKIDDCPKRLKGILKRIGVQ